jgi:hypothetical protein
MKPAAFDYVIADSVDMAVASLGNGGEGLTAPAAVRAVKAKAAPKT